MLKLNHLSRHFGGLAAVNQVSLEVQKGQIVGLIGPNGAGKTTLLNLISGLDKPSNGSIELNGHPIHHLPPHTINRLGIARTYQNIRLFAEMSVVENILAGMHNQGKTNLFSAMFMLPAYRSEERRLRLQAHNLLERLGLNGGKITRSAQAISLSYGDQRRVEIARALATQPQLLLLDEPTAGMNAIETSRLGDLILSLREEGLTVLVIEHDMAFSAQICDQVVVLNFGERIAGGTVEQIKANPLVIDAYLGLEENRDA